jgi:4-amino-4-deoxy-L-arabinose transferase-like glycosyltransferase
MTAAGLTEILDQPVSASRWRFRYPAALAVVVLAAGAMLRFWDLATKPGWQYDEGVYTGVAANLLQHGQISEHITYGAPWSPDLYQPPFYFVILSRWFALTGPSVYHARVLGVLCSVVTLALFWRLLVRLHGDRAALLAVIPVVFDGWLLYVQRVSYMENVLLMLITAGMLLYQRAFGGHLAPLTRVSRWQYAAAGGVLGFAVVFKYTGAYILAAVLLAWLIRRRDHKGHVIMFGAALLVAAGFLLFEIRFYDAPGHHWWLQQTMVQIRRVLGIQSSGGTLSSPAKGLHLLLAQYKVFAPSFLVTVAAFAVGVRRLWRCYQARNWSPVQDNALLFAWMAAGVVIFGFSSLRYPQYFALILLPAYGFFWTEVYRWRWDVRALAGPAVAAMLAGLLSFWARVGANDDNAFAQVQRYAARSIPADAVVVADEAIGDLITQPYCREQEAGPCRGHAAFAITWDTYLQTSWQLGDSADHQMMAGAVPLESWAGFNGTVTVWRLRT